MAVELGTGLTLTAGTSAWQAYLTSCKPANYSREAVRSSHMTTTGAHTFTPADIVEYGDINVEGYYNPATTVPIAAVAETWTIAIAGASVSFTGFMTNFQAKAPMEEYMTFSATVKVSGDVAVA